MIRPHHKIDNFATLVAIVVIFVVVVVVVLVENREFNVAYDMSPYNATKSIHQLITMVYHKRFMAPITICQSRDCHWH